MFNVVNMLKRFNSDPVEPMFIEKIKTMNALPDNGTIDAALKFSYDSAQQDVFAARNRFEHASDSYQDAAILELAAAEARFQAVINEIRANAC